jgi:hypothetical protein
MKDRRIISEIDRSKEIMNFSNKPKKIQKIEKTKEEETIDPDETQIVTLREFVEKK